MNGHKPKLLNEFPYNELLWFIEAAVILVPSNPVVSVQRIVMVYLPFLTKGVKLWKSFRTTNCYGLSSASFCFIPLTIGVSVQRIVMVYLSNILY